MPMQRKYTWMLAALTLGFAANCLAQQSGFRDLTTSWRAPEDHVPSPPSATCPNVKHTISDGDQETPSPAPPARPNKIDLTITEISPPKLRLGEDFTARVRLKNVGPAKILIPWQPDGEQVARVSPDGTEEKYEVADVSFRLAAGGKKSVAIPLLSDGALFAHPDDPATYLPIEPGHWVDIKVKATVACGLDNCRSDIQSDEHSVLTAWWYQRVLTHHVKDCTEDHGVDKVRGVDSAPLPVAVRPAPAPSNSTRKQSAQNPDLASDTLPAGSRSERSQ
jgi:hypothetical protein